MDDDDGAGALDDDDGAGALDDDDGAGALDDDGAGALGDDDGVDVSDEDDELLNELAWLDWLVLAAVGVEPPPPPPPDAALATTPMTKSAPSPVSILCRANHGLPRGCATGAATAPGWVSGRN
ncbi:hypothetical protein [Pedococcus sp. 5OH_020]|uniref:hypothetical protein n=1 Tax=Pedococcus sp. 5OH_020 TaxID=2989814 RepID=UPI0022E9ED6B|nr:hypothetical protein [Pedococcus sp. 5OH_020]